RERQRLTCRAWRSRCALQWPTKARTGLMPTLFIPGSRSVTSTAMSSPENQDNRGRLLTYLFWGGIGVAPMAALLLIVVGSSTTGLRVAAILAIIAVMMIGISITLRRDAASMKIDLEETLLDEIDMLRGDVRADITTAARATHRALSERVASLQESLQGMQREVDAARQAAMEAKAAQPPPALPPPPRPATAIGVVRRTEAVVTRSTYVDPA